MFPSKTNPKFCVIPLILSKPFVSFMSFVAKSFVFIGVHSFRLKF
jgi:hypothetical protein